jgi:hypothetical protein
MANDDRTLLATYRWFRQAVGKALEQIPEIPKRQQVGGLIWQLLGMTADANGQIPENPPASFENVTSEAASLAYAALIVGESLAALESVRSLVEALGGGQNAAAADAIKAAGEIFAHVAKIVDPAQAGKYPSAFGLGKMLLTISGDAATLPANANESYAKKLGQLITNSNNPDDIAVAATAAGVLILLAGSIIDRSFKAPTPSNLTPFTPSPLPGGDPGLPTLNLPFKPFGNAPIDPKLQLSFVSGNPAGVRAKLTGNPPSINRPLGDTGFELGFAWKADAEFFAGTAIPIDGAPTVKVDDAGFEVGLSLTRKKDGGALVLGPVDNQFATVSLAIGELGAGIRLVNADPRIDVFARKGKATLTLKDSLLKQVLAGDLAIEFALEAEADKTGRIRLKDGTGLRVTLPLPQIPGPFQIQLLTFGVDPQNGSFNNVDVELSGSFGISLGPFKGAIDRLGVIAQMKDLFTAPKVEFKFKPPNGAGLSLDLSVVKGGGYLYLDADRGEYAGALELKLMQIGVKAIAILTTKSEAGWALLLMIYGQFPPIQLSFGFTLTGIGGLIGVQHILDTDALSKGLSSGALDSILFPANPVGDAPKIINTLRTLFPVKAGGFVIGPMLELGWSTPSLVTVRMGLLIDTTQIAIIGQAIIQIPPLVDADLAILRLEVDFVGAVQFDPVAIRFDALLRDSRVLFITLTGQFAFRARFGENPTFLISAGGFHPKFKDLPADLPMPFQRIGAGFSIGIVGVHVGGYFAVTSATVQSGFDVRAWADVGVARIDGGWGFDAICYLEPRFYFELDLHADFSAEVAGLDLLTVKLDGMLAGPGRWHIVGIGTIEIPIFPDIHVHVDEAWGSDTATPAVLKDVAADLKLELEKLGNWSAQTPGDGEAYVTLNKVDPGEDVLAHPRSPLSFRQKLIPLGKRLDKIGVARPKDADFFAIENLTYADNPVAAGLKQTLTDHFAAAQFFELSESDRLQGPSFERMDSGITVGSEDFQCAGVIPETLDYEEANLSGGDNVIDRFHLGLLDHVQWMVALGAAGRSPLRDRARLLPAENVKLNVANGVHVVTDRVTAQPVAQAAKYDSYWAARDRIRADAALDSARHQIVEEFEVSA